MVEATANGAKWAPIAKESSRSLWGKRENHYLLISSSIAEPDDDDNAFSDEFTLTDGLISELNRRYEFRGGLILEGFLHENLQANSRLGGLLLEAHEVIRAHFGPGTRMALEVATDPEAREDQQLFVVIRTRFRPKIARALLSELDQEWWLDALPAAQGKMELSLEYI